MRLERSVFGRVKPVDRLALLAELDGRTAKGGGDGQRAGVEVDVRPAQSERFAEPEPDAERYGYKRSQSIAFHGCENRPRIIRPNRADPWLGRLPTDPTAGYDGSVTAPFRPSGSPNSCPSSSP